MANPSTQNQTATNSILDEFNKQAYLGNQYVVGVNAITIGSVGTEYPLLVMTNSSSPSTSLAPALSCFHNLRKFSCGDISGSTGVLFRVYLNPTSVSGGSSVTPVNVRSGSSNKSVCTVLKQPTVGTKGTFLAEFPVGWAAQNQSNAMIIVDPGDSLLITGEPVSGSTTAVAEAVWYEL